MLTKPLLRARREPAGQSYHRSSQARSGHRAGTDSRICPCEGSVQCIRTCTDRSSLRDFYAPLHAPSRSHSQKSKKVGPNSLQCASQSSLPPRRSHQAQATGSTFLDVAGRAANACLLDSRGAALPSPRLQRKPMAGSSDPCLCLCLSPSVSLSLSPDSEAQRRQVPMDTPSSRTSPGLASGSTAQAAAASSASRLQSPRIFLPEQERPHRERRGGRTQAWGSWPR